MKYTAMWNGQTRTRTSKTRVYTHASVVRWWDGSEAIVSWHGSEEAAQKGSLEKCQRDNGSRVIAAIPVTIDIDHVEIGTDLVSPDGTAYWVNDCDDDADGVWFLWLKTAGAKRRRRLYQKDAAGWTVKI